MSYIISSVAGAITSLARSDRGGVVLDGSNVANPSLDVYEEREVRDLETGPRYLYYRIYTKGGAIVSNNPIYSNDQSLSRIFTKSVAPPHTVESLKKHLCKIEGYPEDAESCALFALLSNPEAMDAAAPVSLFGRSGPGLSEHEPLALVVGSDRWFSAVKPNNLFKPPNLAQNPTYVYYRLYSTKGEISSKLAFSKSDSSLGRVETLAIAPPHTVASLKACLIKLEHMAPPSKLFAVLNSEAPMRDDDPLQLLTGTYPGCDRDVPMAFVVDTTLELVKAKQTYDYSARGWLPIVKGEILRTNGITRSHDGYEGYDAINSSGARGFVQAAHVESCYRVAAWFPSVRTTIFWGLLLFFAKIWLR